MGSLCIQSYIYDLLKSLLSFEDSQCGIADFLDYSKSG